MIQHANKNKYQINQANYIAIVVLEQLGLTSPSQQQIDVMESVILLATQPEKLKLEILKICIGDNIARRILLRHLQQSKKLCSISYGFSNETL